jgi:hypothetical protein
MNNHRPSGYVVNNNFLDEEETVQEINPKTVK